MIGVGTRYSDFTTASPAVFADPGVRFVNVNVAAADSAKLAGIALVADARAALTRAGGRAGGLVGQRRVPAEARGGWRPSGTPR